MSIKATCQILHSMSGKSQESIYKKKKNIIPPLKSPNAI